MRLMENFVKGKKMIASFMLSLALMVFMAVPAFAANQDLADANKLLTTGSGDMKTEYLVLIAVVIPIIIVVFGISWLIGLFKRKMNKA
ncbi:hypothetical protein [Paenibacillus ehimensis]|uniref:Uncharacterized protein n=1 Tax=Paenibacillus ehimensis TaxID=79264 RepID=A0ABT8VM90_9BACL|nr:hypothetical protein [Paenibacillus ehimensis]MDO3682091.1 hypothetical protein [Paenibacillus ehimensis]